MKDLRIPRTRGESETIRLSEPKDLRTARPGQRLNRRALAAAHVVADPFADLPPFQQGALDLEASLRFRDHLFDLGLGVAEAMDTAQRGMGLDWTAAQDLIRGTLDLARNRPEAVVYVGVGSDQLEDANADLSAITAAYREQIDFAQGQGARVIVMASRALARAAQCPGDYRIVYNEILGAVEQPAILHWLGAMFDPNLARYWGAEGVEAAMEACLEIIAEHANKVEGIKISLLDKELEKRMRRRLPNGVRMFTGDDFNYPELIAGEIGEKDNENSDALLGIFDPIAPLASAALVALTEGDLEGFHALLDPTVPLSRELFSSPTQYYKTGVVFLAFLNGHQEHFVMLGGLQGGRSLLHLARVFKLAAAVGLLRDPDLAAHRMTRFLSLQGFEQ